MAESVEKQIGDQLIKCTLEEEKKEERFFCGRQLHVELS